MTHNNGESFRVKVFWGKPCIMSGKCIARFNNIFLFSRVMTYHTWMTVDSKLQTVHYSNRSNAQRDACINLQDLWDGLYGHLWSCAQCTSSRNLLNGMEHVWAWQGRIHCIRSGRWVVFISKSMPKLRCALGDLKPHTEVMMAVPWAPQERNWDCFCLLCFQEK